MKKSIDEKINWDIDDLFGIAPYYWAPYDHYFKLIGQTLGPKMKVLEIGAGQGEKSLPTLKTGCELTTTDISTTSLKNFRHMAELHGYQVKIKVADMEDLPFDNNQFDAVLSAGALSYGNPDRVFQEIKRVLKPEGHFIAVDSLNNSPIYRARRYFQYRKGRRTLMTLQNMSDMGTIDRLKDLYKTVSYKRFGTFTFLAPLLVPVLGRKMTARTLDSLDYIPGIGRWAFKIVMHAHGTKKS